MTKKVFTGIVEFESEDYGQALVATIGAEDPDSCMFVRLQSWVDEPRCGVGVMLRRHKEAMEFAGKKVRITVEVADEPDGGVVSLLGPDPVPMVNVLGRYYPSGGR